MNSPLPSGNGTAASSKKRPSANSELAAALLPLNRCRAHQIADQRGAPGLGKLACRCIRQRVDARVAGQELLLEAPQRPELVVPQLQPPIGGKHTQRLVEIVEGRSPHAQQRIARAGKLDLFGTVLEDQQQPAIGQGLRHNAQMHASRQMPLLLDRAARLKEPVAPLRLPSREIAHLGQAIGFAHALQ